MNSIRITLFAMSTLALALAACSGSDIDEAESGLPSPNGTADPGGKADGSGSAILIQHQDNGKTFDVIEGQDVQVMLPENQTTGAFWKIVATDETFGYPTSDNFIEPESGAFGAGGFRQLVWKTQGDLPMLGAHTVMLEYTRDTESFYSFTFTVVIKEAGAGQNECLGDMGTDVSCDDLPFAAALCGDEPSLGASLCTGMSERLRAGVMQRLFECLEDVGASVADPCTDEHNGAAMECYFSTQSSDVCPQAEATAACEAFVSEHTQVLLEDCEGLIRPFEPSAHAAIFSCVDACLALGSSNPDEALTMCAHDPEFLSSFGF